MKSMTGPENVAVKTALGYLNEARRKRRAALLSLEKLLQALDDPAPLTRSTIRQTVNAAMKDVRESRGYLEHLRRLILHCLEKCTVMRYYLKHELAQAKTPNPDDKPFPDGWMGGGRSESKKPEETPPSDSE